jgi:cytochrome c oxidase assembly protein subunit 15
VVLVCVTVVSGAFVAGLRAGEIFNTFPLMGGQVVPPGYASDAGWWRGAFENPAAAQFHHRVLALLTVLAALALAWRATRGAAGRATIGSGAARAIRAVAGVALLQVALGIATLLLSVPITLGVLHQLTGALLLTLAVLALHRVRGS